MSIIEYGLPIAEMTVRERFNEAATAGWVQIFDPMDAVSRVFQHVETLPSRHTTRHTARQYRICLYDYLEFCGAVIDLDQRDKTRLDGDVFDFSEMRIHSPEQMQDYISYCIDEGRTSKTIKKYMAPIRRYLNALRKQMFFGLTGEKRMLVDDVKQIFELAADVNAPRVEYKSSEGAAEKGFWLNLSEVKTYFDEIEQDTKGGRRDLALAYVALITGLRVSELARMRLCDIQPGKTAPYDVRVLGKRNNTDAVGLDKQGYDLIMNYVALYNAGLEDDDPRRIGDKTPLWQPLRRGDNYAVVGVNHYEVEVGMKTNAIRRMFDKRTPDVIRERNGGKGMTPHNWRRTMGTGLRDKEAPLHAIQRQLRHESIATTDKYLKKPDDLSIGLLSNYWHGLIEVA